MKRSAKEMRHIGSRALAMLLAVCLSVMMVPAAAFAIGGDTYSESKVSVKADGVEKEFPDEGSDPVNVDANLLVEKAVEVTAENGGSTEVAWR